MAITASGLFFPTFRDQWDATQLGVDLDAEDMKGALFTNSVTSPDFGTNTAYGVAPFNANETSGGSWSAGGVALTGTAISDESGTWTFDATDVSVGTTTITNARGYLLYDDTNATVADAAICLVDFTSDYSTSNGTFAITWTAPGSGGIFNIDLTP